MREYAFVAFTRRGCELACRIANALEREAGYAQLKTSVSAPERFTGVSGVTPYGTLEDWTRRAFERADALVFVGAAGIAVRSIAPYLEDKFSDPAVVSVDELGKHAVALASGHVGGANDLARSIAALCGGDAVVSTATDVNGMFAIDEWAASQGLQIVERELAKEVSARLLAGGTVYFASDFEVQGPLPKGFVEGGGDLGVLVTLDKSLKPHGKTLHLVPRIVTVGIGCRRGTAVAQLERAVFGVLEMVRICSDAVSTLATIDVKSDESAICELAQAQGWGLRFHSAQELKGLEGTFASSEFVESQVGVDNVCERAAVACGERLLVGKQAADGVTVALALNRCVLAFPADGEKPDESAAEEAPLRDERGLLSVVGLGPGASNDMTTRARQALEASDVIFGYTVYINLLREEFAHKELKSTPMRGEVERCRMALEEASTGKRVAMVCSGDPGIYGMAGLCYELAGEFPEVDIRVVSGVSAANGGAAVLGAPLMHDFAVISLSDLLTPWEKIERRLDAAARADFVICLYNPSSRKRAGYLRRACEILMRYKSAETVCGTVRNIGREGERAQVMTLGELSNTDVDMFTTVFIGNSQTMEIDGKMVTPRGYLQRED